MKGPYETELDEEYDRREAVEQAIEGLHDAIAEFWEEERYGAERYDESPATAEA